MGRESQVTPGANPDASNGKTKRPYGLGATTSPAGSEMETKDRYFRELYTKSPDFKEIAQADPDFSNMIKGRELDFNDPKAIMQLTKTLLKLDFGLNVELPEDRLCPPVANRHNYILWLKTLLDTSSYEEPGRKVVGLDIGSGASCIYPLLGCAQRPWSFIATDIDDKNLTWAKKNVKLNDLEGRINVVGRKADEALVPLDDLNVDSIDFSMTNPPFYESKEEMVKSAKQKSRPPFSACTGAEVEMVTEGGEVGFIGRILNESLVLRERVQWYTAMVGFLASLTHIIEKLREHKIDNYAVTEFLQGNKTRRWAIAWSFGPLRPSQDVARGTKAALSKNILPAITEFVAAKLPIPKQIGKFADDLSSSIATLELISWNWNKEQLEGVGRAADKVWSRAWRRRKQRELNMEEDKKDSKTAMEEQPCMFGFKVAILVARDHASVEARWLEGHDETAFESFRGFLKAASETALEGSKG